MAKVMNIRNAALLGAAISSRRLSRRLMKRATRAALLGAGGMALAGTATAVAGYAAWRVLNDVLGENMTNKVVMITGSSRGLGFALAQEFARLGARLVICARDANELHWAQAELEKLGVQVLGVECDVSDNDQVQRMVQQAMARFGRIDVLVNNAGIISVGPLESQTLADFEESMRVMYWGTVYPTLAVLPHMRERRRGRIANITSIGGKIAFPHLLPYSCAKFAAVGFSEGLRAELLKDGIKVTTVVPGLMRTGSHVNAYFKGDNQAEYNMFSLTATSPLTAIGARRAARRIVGAVRVGRAEIVLSWPAHAAALIHGIFPGQTANILGWANGILPSGDNKDRYTGKQSETKITKSALTALGRLAGERLHQYPERHGVVSQGPAGVMKPQTQVG